jgi:hypothetical protein
MSKWPVSANRVLEIISGSPTCCVCDMPAVRFVTVAWGFGQYSDHPVCATHLAMYRVDFDRLGRDLRKIARQSRTDAEGEGIISR